MKGWRFLQSLSSDQSVLSQAMIRFNRFGRAFIDCKNEKETARKNLVDVHNGETERQRSNIQFSLCWTQAGEEIW